MKRKMKQLFVVIGASGIVLLVILFGLAFLEQKVYCNVRLKQSVEVEYLKSETMKKIVFWEEIRGVCVSNPMLGSNCEGDCVYVVGALEQMQDWKIVDGTLFLDADSVVISNKLSQQLFRSEYAVGQSIQYGEQQYWIRGIVDDSRCKMYLAAAVPQEDTGRYKWIQQVLEKEICLTHVTYAKERKKCLLNKIEDEVQFILQKNGYPEIDMIL